MLLVSKENKEVQAIQVCEKFSILQHCSNNVSLHPGLDGIIANKGIRGEDGISGLPGVKGAPGRDGGRGKRGLDGDYGYPGRPGYPGLPGLAGNFFKYTNKNGTFILQSRSTRKDRPTRRSRSSWPQFQGRIRRSWYKWPRWELWHSLKQGRTRGIWAAWCPWYKGLQRIQ